MSFLWSGTARSPVGYLNNEMNVPFFKSALEISSNLPGFRQGQRTLVPQVR
jgi:hypothetical protein